MTKEIKVFIIILLALVIGATILISNIITSFKKTNTSGYKELIEAKDETIKAVGMQRDLLLTFIAAADKKDSILVEALKSNQPKYKANDKKLQDVIANVNNYTKDELRRAFAEY